MNTEAAIHEYGCQKGRYKSTCTILRELVLTKKAFLNMVCSVAALVTSKKRSCSSVFTASTPPSVLFMFLVIVRLSTAASCTITVGTGCEFFKTIFLSAGRFAL